MKIPAEIRARAIAAGATPPLEFLGEGMTAIVLGDDADLAWKVYKPWPPEYRDREQYAHEAEAEWLITASRDPDLAKYVPRNVRWHPREQVVERECIYGRPGGWGTRWLREIFDILIPVMRERYGWGRPEFKEDSFVVEEDEDQEPTGRIILVDAGFPQRFDENLVQYVREVLAGRTPHEDIQDLLYALRISVLDKDIAESVAEPLMRALEKMR